MLAVWKAVCARNGTQPKLIRSMRLAASLHVVSRRRIHFQMRCLRLHYYQPKELLAGLDYIKRSFTRSAHNLEVRGDSQLIINAFRGRNRIQAATLTPHDRVIKALIGAYASVEWTHIMRKHNKAADFLANVAMDAKATGVAVPPTLQGDNQRKFRVEQLIEQDHLARQEHEDTPILIARMRKYARSEK